MRKLNNYAADMIPIRLIISISVIAAISILIAFGYLYLKVVLSENQIENECNDLESKLTAIVSSGVARDVDMIDFSEGTKRCHTFNIPDNLMYLGFGVDPDPNGDGILETGLTEDGNVIVYRIQGGSKKIIWLDREYKFREGIFKDGKWNINNDLQGYIISSSRRTTINFEYVEKNNEQYILIQKTDNYNI